MTDVQFAGKTDFISELILDPDIRFQRPMTDIGNIKAVFLTGATGLLGTYLLDELLHTTQADIYCLCRADDAASAYARLKDHLKFHALWNEKFSSRIIPIAGDLSKQLLGLSENQFKELAGQSDIIYHSGAHVNFARPYETLRPTNVFGTHEVLRLASLVRTKPVHFISSMAVFFTRSYSKDDHVLETDLPEYNPDMKGGYKQSKWVAERLIMTAQERGLPACIYRPVRVLGHSKTGDIINFNDLLCKFIKVCIELKKYPALDTKLDFVPVDYVSRTVVHLSQQKESFGKAFHFVNRHPITWKAFFGEIRKLGYLLEEVSYESWLEELRDMASQHPDNATYSSMVFTLMAPIFLFAIKPTFDDTQTEQGVSGTSISCPRIDSELISIYISYLKGCCFIS